MDGTRFVTCPMVSTFLIDPYEGVSRLEVLAETICPLHDVSKVVSLLNPVKCKCLLYQDCRKFRGVQHYLL